MTVLPDTGLSRAVLVGASSYQVMDDLAAVHNNVGVLSAALSSADLWGLPAGHCAVVENPETVAAMLDPVVKAADEATDTLLFYYAGHGLVDRRGELHLTLTGSDPQRMYTAVPYGLVRDALLDGGAERTIVILDCCYSGRALGRMGGGAADEVANEASAAGTYVLAAVSENKSAMAPPGARFTAFTGQLLQVIEQGISGRGPLLDLDAIYLEMLDAMRAKGLPSPQKRDRNTAGQLAFIRNRAYAAEAAMPASGPGRAATPGPGEPRRPGLPLQVLSSAELVRSVHDAWYCQAVSPDGRLIAACVASAVPERSIAGIWDLATGDELMRIKHADAVKKVAFSHDSKRLLTVSGSSVRIWDPGNGQLKDRLTFRHPVERAVFSPDGKKAAVLTFDASHTNRIRVMDIAAHSAVWSYEEFADEIAYHPSGNYLAIASALGQAKILDPTRPEDEAEVLAVSHYRPRGYKWINSVSFSPDGRWLATGSADRTARIWDVTNGAELLSILHRRQVATAVFSPDGRWLATSSHDETTRIWDAADGTELLRITGTGGTDEIDFTPDSSVIAVNGIGIRLYRIAG